MRSAIIVVAHGRHDHLQLQHEMLWRSTVQPASYVVVAIDDTALEDWHPCAPEAVVIPFVGDPGGLPVAAARNAGAAEAIRLGAELLIFLDVDCLPDVDLIHWYERASQEDPSALLCGPVAYLPPRPTLAGYDLDTLASHPFHPARPAPGPGELRGGGDHRLFWSLSFAVTPTVWERIGGFCPEYLGYGAEDTDFAQAAKSVSIDLTWVGGAAAYHQWHPTSIPPVQHLDDILRNGEIFAGRWGWWPMQGWLDEFLDRGLIRWDEPSRRYVRVVQDESSPGPEVALVDSGARP